MISIVVPIYNVENYLVQCIDSILAQTYRNMEIILVDDGSTDSSGRICDEYREKDKRIQVIHKCNGGLMSAWKAGAKISTGEYIGFVDSDDWIDSDMYQKLFYVANSTNAEIVVCGWIRESTGKSEKEKIYLKEGLYQKDDIKSKIIPKMINFGPMLERFLAPNRVTKLFKTELIKSNMEFFDERVSVGEDMLSSFACVFDCESLYIMSSFYPYHYRLNEQSIMEKPKPDFTKQVLQLELCLKKMCEKKCTLDLNVQLHNDLIGLLYWGMERYVFSDSTMEYKLEYIKEIAQNEYMQKAIQNETLTHNSKKCKIYTFFIKHRKYRILIYFIKYVIRMKRNVLGY